MKTFAAALRAYFPATDGITAGELAAFIRACSPDDKAQFARELSEILGEEVAVSATAQAL